MKKYMTPKNIFLSLFVLAILVLIPLAIDKYIMGNHILSNWSNGDWSGFLGSYLGGLFGGIATLLAIYVTTTETRSIEEKHRKLKDKELKNSEIIESRSFLLFDEIFNLGLRLERYDSVGDGDVRLLETSNFIEMDKIIKENHYSNNEFNYLRIKNIGPKFVTNCRFKITISAEDGKSSIDVCSSFPMLQVNQEVFVFILSHQLIGYKQGLTYIEFNYKTTSGEELRYIYKVIMRDNRKICIQSYQGKNGDRYEEIFGTDTEPFSWIYPKHFRSIILK